MKELLIRLVTAAVSGGIFFGAFFYSLPLFIGLLVGALLWILFFEWPQIINYQLGATRYWTLSLMYPIAPFMILLLFSWWHYHVPVIALYPYIASWGVDAASYFSGRLLGRHLLIPSVSPKKTWEGVLGGFIVLFIIHIGMLILLKKEVVIIHMLALSALVTIVALAGDLFVSLLKRWRSLKDTGTFLPGHGGLLDRFDSVLFIAILLVVLQGIGYPVYS